MNTIRPNNNISGLADEDKWNTNIKGRGGEPHCCKLHHQRVHWMHVNAIFTRTIPLEGSCLQLPLRCWFCCGKGHDQDGSRRGKKRMGPNRKDRQTQFIDRWWYNTKGGRAAECLVLRRGDYLYWLTERLWENPKSPGDPLQDDTGFNPFMVMFGGFCSIGHYDCSFYIHF